MSFNSSDDGAEFFGGDVQTDEPEDELVENQQQAQQLQRQAQRKSAKAARR